MDKIEVCLCGRRLSTKKETMLAAKESGEKKIKSVHKNERNVQQNGTPSDQ